MDTLGALALATEPPNEGLLKRPPVGRGVSFITMAMWRNIIGQSIYQLAVLGVLNFDGERLLKFSGSDATEVLNTVIFNSFVFCQVCGISLSGATVFEICILVFDNTSMLFLLLGGVCLLTLFRCLMR